jgi:tagatose-1,6-bisphosphate aldolase
MQRSQLHAVFLRLITIPQQVTLTKSANVCQTYGPLILTTRAGAGSMKGLICGRNATANQVEMGVKDAQNWLATGELSQVLGSA